ncbi:MAG: hypothetical protein E6G68_03165 [Actinobacteria bacterium]|nr:MAG: hypothetical protein E6G68_03165 [Actinomycetota bacterium]
MDRATAIFVEGMGAAAATSGVLTQLQGRIFGLLYLQRASLSLDEIVFELGQSKGNVSINIRGLVDWHRARTITRRRATSGGSCRKSWNAASGGTSAR